MRIHSITIHMNGPESNYSWREWIGIKLFDLAQKIAGWKFEVTWK